MTGKEIVPMRLSELEQRIAMVLNGSGLTNCWVIADLSDVGVRGGHCYLELMEKDARTGAPVAKIRGIIWATRYAEIAQRFLQTTGQQIASGMKVMLCVTVNFHPVFGISLVISDINPEYTIGDMERQRREIIERLKRDGVYDINKSLPLPDVPQRLAVISSATAAGYGDFIKQLENNPGHIRFTTTLYEARMQGVDTPVTIINALDRISQCMDEYDAVVIIRGGGSTSDLNSFDNYELAFQVAQFPLPVITGIGHERDNTVIDYVACVRQKTPTAVAAWLISRGEGVLAALDNAGRTISALAREMVGANREQLKYVASAVPMLARGVVERHGMNLRHLATGIPALAGRRVEKARAGIESYGVMLRQIIAAKLRFEEKNLEAIGQRVELLSPMSVLRRGYSITSVGGKTVTSIEKVTPGMEITTTLADGVIVSGVESKYFKK